MFSFRTIRGTLTVIITDALIGYLVFGVMVSNLPGAPAWLAFNRITGNLMLLAFILPILFSLALNKLYSYVAFMIRPTEMLGGFIPSFFISCFFIITLCFLIKSLSFIDWKILLPVCETFLVLFIFRYFIFYKLKKNRVRILILGRNDQTQEIVEEAKARIYRGYDIVGIITAQKSEVGNDFYGVPVLSHIDQFCETVRNHPVDCIVVTLRERRGQLPFRQLIKLKLAHIRIHEGSEFYERAKRKIMIDEYLKPSWIIFEEGFFLTPIHGAVKRAQSLIVSFTLLALLSPVLLLVAILIKLDSPGSVFYQQERVGLHGRIFHLLKFRSMYQNAEKDEKPVFARKDDSRITRVGRIIRRLRLDEFPQFINVFKGDMNLVGPRPERPYFVKQLEETISYYDLRNDVRPGITGWAQINYPYGDSLEDSREKLQYDLYYLKHYSWHMDLVILFLTIKEVLFGSGR
ncbi:MAG: sugar transferase [Desulfobacteraceae bacterium]|nr:MAG: sugar transferase [Desulfobacteraceae bacterium]